jgi:hypothetical protein
MPKTQMDYSNTIMYKICCKDTLVTDMYIGHTTNFLQRKHNHKSNCCNPNLKNYNLNVYKFIRNNGGWNNWSMIQLETYNCNNSNEALMRERYWMELLKPKLNINNSYTTNEEKEIQKKEWYEENKEKILQKAKENYEENKEQKLEYQKQYTEENKNLIKHYQEEYREKNKEKLADQKKIYRAEHKEEAQKAHKEWKESNKEKLAEQRKQIINCECGNKYTFGNKHRHFESKVHIEYQNKLCGIMSEKEPKLSIEEKTTILHQKQKEYREKNAEKIKEFKKKYNEKNKEKVSEQCKKYYEENKEKVLEQTKKYTSENAEKIKQKSHEWYEKNKEKILNKMQEIFVCECGVSIRCGGKAEHYKSIKHMNYIEGNTIFQQI